MRGRRTEGPGGRTNPTLGDFSPAKVTSNPTGRSLCLPDKLCRPSCPFVTWASSPSRPRGEDTRHPFWLLAGSGLQGGSLRTHAEQGCWQLSKGAEGRDHTARAWVPREEGLGPPPLEQCTPAHPELGVENGGAGCPPHPHSLLLSHLYRGGAGGWSLQGAPLNNWKGSRRRMLEAGVAGLASYVDTTVSLSCSTCDLACC